MKPIGILFIGLILGTALGVEGTMLFIKPVSKKQHNELAEKIETLENNIPIIESLENRVEAIEAKLGDTIAEVSWYEKEVDELKAFTLMRMELSEIDEILASEITDEIYEELLRRDLIEDWLEIVDTEEIKNTLSASFSEYMNNLLWKEYAVGYAIGDKKYHVWMLTEAPVIIYIPELGEVSFSIRLVVFGKVNVYTEKITELHIYKVSLS